VRAVASARTRVGVRTSSAASEPPLSAPRTTKDSLLSGSLILLLLAGTIKSSPLFMFIPVDLTAAVGVVVFLVVGTLLLGTHHLRPGQVWPTMLLVIGFLPGLFIPVESSYAQSKVLYLFTLTLGCSWVGANLIVSSQRRREGLLIATVGAGLLIALMERIAPSTKVEYGRLALEGSNTIAIARFTGAALLAVIVLAATRRLRLLYAVPMGGAFLYLTIGSGSRGPALAVVVAGTVVSALRQGPKRLRSVVTMMSMLALGGWWAFQQASPLARDRFGLLFADVHGHSVDVRESLVSRAWQVVQDNPFGVGWGGLAPRMNSMDMYPHNLVLEVLGEGGWIAGAALLVVSVVAVKRVLCNLAEPASLGILSLFIYWATNALVSGDLNDNRAVFVMLAACLATDSIRPNLETRRLVVRR